VLSARKVPERLPGRFACRERAERLRHRWVLRAEPLVPNVYKEWLAGSLTASQSSRNMCDAQRLRSATRLVWRPVDAAQAISV
jgi:hypothetical protein